TSGASSLSLSQSGRTALSGGEDGTIRVWDVETGKCVRVFEVRSGETPVPVHAVCLSRDARFAFSGGQDGWARLWELESGRCLRIYGYHRRPVLAMDLSRDDGVVLAGYGDLVVNLWQVGTGQGMRSLGGATTSNQVFPGWYVQRIE